VRGVGRRKKEVGGRVGAAAPAGCIATQCAETGRRNECHPKPAINRYKSMKIRSQGTKMEENMVGHWPNYVEASAKVLTVEIKE